MKKSEYRKLNDHGDVEDNGDQKRNLYSRDTLSLSKPRRQRQPERHQTKDLMSKAIAPQVRYKSLYISLRSSGKQEREMTKVCVV